MKMFTQRLNTVCFFLILVGKKVKHFPANEVRFNLFQEAECLLVCCMRLENVIVRALSQLYFLKFI